MRNDFSRISSYAQLRASLSMVSSEISGINARLQQVCSPAPWKRILLLLLRQVRGRMEKGYRQG